jgi:hypothetical protein
MSHTPTPWDLWTSNSYRRIVAREGGHILYGTQHPDGTGDLVFSNPEDAEFMVRAVNTHDDTVKALEVAEAALTTLVRDLDPGASYASMPLAALKQVRLALLQARTVGDWVPFGTVARDFCGMQAQYASHYVDGRHPGAPHLGKGLRFRGTGGKALDTADYHNIEIHKDDVETFVRRVLERL